VAHNGPPSISKRNREHARQEKNQQKAARRDQRAHERRERAGAPPAEDPDIAGIVPGPQRPIWEQ
jgi:hypothetical protein